MPVINIVNADSERAAAYLRFTSDILQPNEITDYLARVIQPRKSARLWPATTIFRPSARPKARWSRSI